MATLSIIRGRVIDPASNLDLITDLHIAEGQIIAMGSPPANFSADKLIDATDQIVCPGLVDLSVRLREPGAEHKGTIFSETRAAAANGITTVCCPPDSDPVIDTQAIAELLQQRAAKAGMAKVLPLAALTQGLKGEHLAEMGILKETGCIAVSNVLPIVNTDVFRYALEYAANYELTVFLHARDPWLGHNGCAHEGAISTRLGLSGIPEATETIEVARDLLLIEMTGVRAHFCQLSSARAVELIKQAQAKGLPVTADVSAHHLFLTDQDINNYNTQCHVFPPLRSEQDKEALREGLLQGTINAICSDHQPHETDAKLNPFSMSAPGISGLDTLLPLTLHLAEAMPLDLITALSYVTHKPAQLLGLDAGSLAIGMPADICIFDPNRSWRLSPDNMYSKGHNSPFLGWEFKGKVTYTLSNGRLIWSRHFVSSEERSML
ncbi:MAG: dihydroorotase [Candidatus Parabeggiatoa sp.]|nr:dihydroorotase [Candidatus Parabeggiatoa sp.]